MGRFEGGPKARDSETPDAEVTADDPEAANNQWCRREFADGVAGVTAPLESSDVLNPG